MLEYASCLATCCSAMSFRREQRGCDDRNHPLTVGGMRMTRATADVVLIEDSLPSPHFGLPDATPPRAPVRDAFVTETSSDEVIPPRRHTRRKSLMVVVPENLVVPADMVAQHLAGESESDRTEVILACAGQPTGIASLQRTVRDLQVVLAPAGTSGEDLRELAMQQAPGDIVTLLNGARLGG